MAHKNEWLFTNLELWRRAEQLCRQRLQTNPDDRAALRSLAEASRKLGDLSGAAAAFDRLFALDPQDSDAGYLQAVFGGREWPRVPEGVRAAPFVLLKDFLPRDFHSALLPFLLSVREQFVPLVPSANEPYKPESRQTLEFRGKWKRQPFDAAVSAALPRVIPRLHLPEFKVGPFELTLRAYQDGHYFKIHQDAPAGSRYAHRALNFVYYLHKVPRPYTGGELLLFDTDPQADAFTRSGFTRVVPEDNALIFFPPNFYHCVVPIRCLSNDFADSRFTITGHVRVAAPTVPAPEECAVALTQRVQENIQPQAEEPQAP